MTLSDEAVAQGQAYAAAQGLSLSQLTDRLLRALPGPNEREVADLPQRLARLRRLAIHAGPPVDWRAEYREHLLNRYAGKRRT